MFFLLPLVTITMSKAAAVTITMSKAAAVAITAATTTAIVRGNQAQVIALDLHNRKTPQPTNKTLKERNIKNGRFHRYTALSPTNG